VERFLFVFWGRGMSELNIYLASRTEQENLIIRRKLEVLNGEFRDLRFNSLHPQGLVASVRERMTVVVINLPEWGKSEMKYIYELRAAGYSGPLLVISKPNDGPTLQGLLAMRGVVLLERPFVEKDLVGIVRKMLTDQEVAQRIHRRFNTEEQAEVELCDTKDRYVSWMYNLSKGGAYLEFLTPAPVRVGDRVRMTIELHKTKRVYSLPARVVWTQRKGIRGGAAAGVEFIGAPEVRKTAIEEF